MKLDSLLAETFASLSLDSTFSADAVIPKSQVVQNFFESEPDKVKKLEEEILNCYPSLGWGDTYDISKEKDKAPFQCEISSVNENNKKVDLLKICKLNGEDYAYTFAFFHNGRYGNNWFWVTGNEDLAKVAEWVVNAPLDGFTICIVGDGSHRESGGLCSLLIDTIYNFYYKTIDKFKEELNGVKTMELKKLIDWIIMDKLERCAFIEVH